MLRDVSITLPGGVLTGFVAANGAGKTTTMRIVVGLLSPDAGSVLWDGAPVTAQHRRRFGYLPEERGLYPKQPVREQLIYFGRLHRMSRRNAAVRADELLDLLRLASRRGDVLETLSLGNQQRVQIAVALMHRPRLLILDEPFSALDPDAVETMGALLRATAADGVPVMFSSHQLDVVERLCDGLIIISAGRRAPPDRCASGMNGSSVSRARASGRGSGSVPELPSGPSRPMPLSSARASRLSPTPCYGPRWPGEPSGTSPRWSSPCRRFTARSRGEPPIRPRAPPLVARRHPGDRRPVPEPMLWISTASLMLLIILGVAALHVLSGVRTSYTVGVLSDDAVGIVRSPATIRTPPSTPPDTPPGTRPSMRPRRATSMRCWWSAAPPPDGRWSAWDRRTAG